MQKQEFSKLLALQFYLSNEILILRMNIKQQTQIENERDKFSIDAMQNFAFMIYSIECQRWD